MTRPLLLPRALALLLAGCAFMRPAHNDLSTRAFVERGPQAARGVIVMLPGYGDRPRDFENDGFVDRLAAHAPGYDLIGVDLHFNYYRKGRVLPRLEQDVLGPLRARGYGEIWILGVSMGGLGAVLYAREHPEQVSGLLLFAPFLGRGRVAADVAQAGSLCAWEPRGPSGELSEEDRAYLKNWRWLQQAACQTGDGPSLWIAHGEQDRPSPAGRSLIEQLPPWHHVSLPGGHRWSTWAALVDVIAPRALNP